MNIRVQSIHTSLSVLFAFILVSGLAVAGPESNPSYSGITVAFSDTPNPEEAANPCAAVNACAAKNPCAVNPCAVNPCAANPCAVNPCAVNPCAANPCAAAVPDIDPEMITRPADSMHWQGDSISLAVKGKSLWEDTKLSSNGLSCNTCHQGNGAFMSTFKDPYPHHVAMAKSRTGLDKITMEEMVQLCMVVPMAAKPLPWDSQELAALTAYTAVIQKSYQMAGANPCAANPCAMKNPCAENPCAANPCAMKNPCAANPCAANPCAMKNPCAANPCAANPCAMKNPCAANPCAANPCAMKNPCAANPCAANPCAMKNPCAR